MDIELGDAVAALKDQLLDAADRATTAEVEFAVGPIELEFAVELRMAPRSRPASRTTKHRVSITLTPRRPGGGDVLVSQQVAGEDGPGELTGHLGRSSWPRSCTGRA